MDKQVYSLIRFIESLGGKVDKAKLSKLVQGEFGLIKDRSVFYNDTFAIRFSSSKSTSFSNTVISLSNLQKYDDSPFIVCLNTPKNNYLYLANTTFIAKISHSSQELREDNIRGSINGSDISKKFNEIENCPDNFAELFAIHSEIGFSGNLARLVEATNNISTSGSKFEVSESDKDVILLAPERAKKFVVSDEYKILKKELDETTKKYENEIILASLIDNVNIRGRVIEYIIAGEDEKLRSELLDALRNGTKRIPSFRTKNTLGDFIKIFDKYNTATDIKTKVMILNSAPKAYNLDKILEFLSKKNSVFLFYFVGIMPKQIIGQVLISIFQDDLRNTTHLLAHWAGRNSRGVAQFSGQVLNNLIKAPNNNIDIKQSQEFLNHLIGL
jgi:hypothetical protein